MHRSLKIGQISFSKSTSACAIDRVDIPPNKSDMMRTLLVFRIWTIFIVCILSIRFFAKECWKHGLPSRDGDGRTFDRVAKGILCFIGKDEH